MNAIQARIEEIRKQNAVKVGLIRGRHPLPVERYLIEQETVPFDRAHTMAAEAMKRLLEEVPSVSVSLYVTGLTRATLGAVAGFMQSEHAEGRTLYIYEYNTATGEYETVISFWSDSEYTNTGTVLFTRASLG